MLYCPEVCSFPWIPTCDVIQIVFFFGYYISGFSWVSEFEFIILLIFFFPFFFKNHHNFFVFRKSPIIKDVSLILSIISLKENGCNLFRCMSWVSRCLVFNLLHNNFHLKLYSFDTRIDWFKNSSFRSCLY